ncbi:hypothetical protein Trydic_g6998 [Trypoxylus dichotomus]
MPLTANRPRIKTDPLIPSGQLIYHLRLIDFGRRVYSRLGVIARWLFGSVRRGVPSSEPKQPEKFENCVMNRCYARILDMLISFSQIYIYRVSISKRTAYNHIQHDVYLKPKSAQ